LKIGSVEQKNIRKQICPRIFFYQLRTAILFR